MDMFTRLLRENVDYVDLNKYNISNVIPYIYKYLMAKHKIKQMFVFIKKVFFLGLTVLSNSLLSATPLNWISMKN